MSYLSIILSEDNFPQINFRKLAANRNKRLYLFLNLVKWTKGVFLAFARKPQEIEKCIIESYLTIQRVEEFQASLQADYKTS